MAYSIAGRIRARKSTSLKLKLIFHEVERAVCLHLLAQKPPRLTHRAVLAVMLMFAAAAGYLKDADDADDARGPLQCAASSGQ
ncbi:hypothetical protein V8C40DRAFT_260788 [Trichoderma camerunense]